MWCKYLYFELLLTLLWCKYENTSFLLTPNGKILNIQKVGVNMSLFFAYLHQCGVNMYICALIFITVV